MIESAVNQILIVMLNTSPSTNNNSQLFKTLTSLAAMIMLGLGTHSKLKLRKGRPLFVQFCELSLTKQAVATAGSAFTLGALKIAPVKKSGLSKTD